jgi:AbrB family looped-hinge helix DNA binding protein
MNQRYVAKITSKGQLTLPRQVRQSLGVGPGDQIAFEVGPEGVSVTPAHPESRFREWEGRWRQGKGWTREEIDAWIHEMRGHNELAPWP